MTEMTPHTDFSDFPAVILAESLPQEASTWLSENRTYILALLERQGAVLLRGFGLVSDTDFDAAISSFGLPAFTYEESLSNAVRRNRTDKVFTANEAPAEIEIFLHHEMAQTPRYPGKLFFFCEQAAESGGATPLCRSDLLLQAMREHMPEFVAQCEGKGLRYTNIMPLEADALSGQGRSWKSTLSSANQAEAESRLKTLGYSWQWLDDGSLKATTPVLPAIKSLECGTEVFFNQLIAAFMGWKDSRNRHEKVVRFGDGSEIVDEDMQQVVKLSTRFTYDLQWQTGDMAVVDNFLVMHGRRPFTGERRVLASLTG